MPKKGPFQKNSRTFPGVLSNLPIFQDAFLRPISGLSRTSGHTVITKKGRPRTTDSKKKSLRITIFT